MSELGRRIAALTGLAPRAVRPVAGDALTIMQKRMPRLPKAQATDDIMALDPLLAVLSGYGERADEALARARLFQQDPSLQFLDDGRWYANRAAGVTGREMPLLSYPGSVIPGTKGGVEGFFRTVPSGPLASVQVAMGGQNVRDILLEESRHAIDRQLVRTGRPSPFKAPEAFASLLSHASPDRARQYMNYYSVPGEMRATLSGMLAEHPEFVSTTQQATDLLEGMRAVGTVRERATAEGILNSRGLRNEYIPYLLRALSVGGVAPMLMEEE